MHYGSIHNDTAAGRTYRLLKAFNGLWMDSWYLTRQARSTAIGTRISEIRKQLPAGERVETKQEGHKFFYRLVVQ